MEPHPRGDGDHPESLSQPCLQRVASDLAHLQQRRVGCL
jgi:hypothetical protein